MISDDRTVSRTRLADLRLTFARELDVEMRAKAGLSLANQVIAWLILISVAVIVLETEPTVYQPFARAFLWFETALLIILVVEYLLRLWCATENPRYPNRLAFVIRPLALLDLLVILSMAFSLVGVEGVVLRLMRLLRLLRLAKLGGFSRAFDDISAAISKRRFELGLSVIIAAVMMLITASALYVVEAAHQPEAFGSIPRAMWWSMATLTTVGYGDIVPVTAAGRIFATLTALTGVGLIAMPAGILAAAFSEVVQKRMAREERAEQEEKDGL